MVTERITRAVVTLVLTMSLVACATTQRSNHVKRSKPHSTGHGNNFSLYSNKSLDKKILNRGKKNLGSVAMETY